MRNKWHKLPLFYLLSGEDWPSSRRGTSFLAAMRDATRCRFGDPRFEGLASTYRFATLLPPTNTLDPDDEEEVTRILEWHHPYIHVERYQASDFDDNAPTGTLVRRWTVYDLDETDWQRARDIEACCARRNDVHLREFDALLNGFAQAAFDGKIETFAMLTDRTTIPIEPAFWDVDLPVLRARHAHGRYAPENASSRSPHGSATIFVDAAGLQPWLASISPIAVADPPNLDAARAFLIDLETALRSEADRRHAEKGGQRRELGIPGGTETLFGMLKMPPCNLRRLEFDTLINERSSEIFEKRGRPADVKIARKIIATLALTHFSGDVSHDKK